MIYIIFELIGRQLEKPCLLPCLLNGLILNSGLNPLSHRTARQRSPSSYGDVFLAPTEIDCAALGPDSLSLTEDPHPTFRQKSK